VKIFVIGGGFVGSNFVKKYFKDYEIILCQNSTNEELSEFCRKNNILTEKCKIETFEIKDLILHHKPNVVLHLATFGNLTKCESYPDEAFKVNVFGTWNVLNACKEIDSTIIYISSREVYGNSTANSVSETDQLLPSNILGITKMLSENLIIKFNETHNLNFTIFRPTNIFGPENGKFVVSRMVKFALKEKKIEIFGGNQQINLIHIDDVLYCINEAIKQQNLSRNQIFNIGSSNNITILDLAKKIQMLIGQKIELHVLDARKGETANFKPSIKKLAKFFKFKPMNDLDTKIIEIIDYMEDR